MSAKPVIPRERANRDVDDAIAYYLKEHAGQAALGFVKALEDAYAFLSRHPGAGASVTPMSLTSRGCGAGRCAGFRT